MLRVEAFKVRNDWARLPAESNDAGTNRAVAALVRQLRLEAVNMPGSNPFRVPRWFDRWWGE